MKRKATKKDNIEIEFVNRVTSLFPAHIIKIIFFGSRVKGIPKPGSDYDFLIVLLEKDRKVVERLYDVVIDFLIEYGADISLKVYNNKEYQRMVSIPTPFMASIVKTGKELWSRRLES
jgi:predicted nucleotidyltransferase